jgi:hypothetical protein
MKTAAAAHMEHKLYDGRVTLTSHLTTSINGMEGNVERAGQQ